MLKKVLQSAANFAGHVMKRNANENVPSPPVEASSDIPTVNHHYATAGKSQAQIAAIKAKVDAYAAEVGWFHSFDFGNGVVAKGHTSADQLAKRLVSLGLKGDLTGQTFLDIASWDGFYAFEAERLGAARVLATDYFCWVGKGWGKKGGFQLVRDILQSKVEDKEIEVQDLSPSTVGLWDIVLFSGIFYHMRDPIQAITAAASVCKTQMIVETHIWNDEFAVPLMQYIPRTKDGNANSNDWRPNSVMITELIAKGGNINSNYWRPNSAMIILLLKELGFSRIEHRIETDPPTFVDSHGFFNAYRS